MSRKDGQAPHGFKYVRETPEEVAEFVARKGHRPSSYRVECLTCGQRIWGAGMAVGTHHYAKRHKDAVNAELAARAAAASPTAKCWCGQSMAMPYGEHVMPYSHVAQEAN